MYYAVLYSLKFYPTFSYDASTFVSFPEKPWREIQNVPFFSPSPFSNSDKKFSAPNTPSPLPALLPYARIKQSLP